VPEGGDQKRPIHEQSSGQANSSRGSGLECQFFEGYDPIHGLDAVWTAPSDLRPLPGEDPRQRRFGETCGRGDGFVANPGLPQFLDVGQHKRGRETNARHSPARCAAARPEE